jgi:hypothetical protein
LLPCNEEVRNNCLAFKGSTKACWMIKNAHCTMQGNECRKCHVYRFGSLHTEGIKLLVHSGDDRKKQRETILKAIED